MQVRPIISIKVLTPLIHATMTTEDREMVLKMKSETRNLSAVNSPAKPITVAFVPSYHVNMIL